jgi:hypothetical protein
MHTPQSGLTIRSLSHHLAANHQLRRVEPRALTKWLKHALILEIHLAHLPATAGHGVRVNLPSGCGMPLIDGNHRATRALRLEEPFFAVVLNEKETHELLRLSMTLAIADQLWRRLEWSSPHPSDQRARKGNYIFCSPASLRVRDDPAVGRFEIRCSLTRLFFKAS